MDAPPASLDALGIRHGTDKSSLGHDYLSFYDRFFARFRDRPIRVLEIGIFKGASLKVWQDYFPRATIVGADINPAVPRFDDPRVIIEVLDQSNLEHLVGLGVRHGPFDIIIEDGSHHWEHQITTLRTLFPFLRPGGIYVAEDLQTNYGALAAKFRGAAATSCMDYLKRLVDLRVGDDQIDIRLEEDAFLRTYGRAVRFVAFHRHCCLIEKAEDGAPAGHGAHEPILAVPERSIRVRLAAHVGGVGDQDAPNGAIRGLKELHNIQGFQLLRDNDLVPAVEYRARLADGNWTGWVPSGRFVGMRGKSQDLTGFAVRLAQPMRAACTLRVAGLFRDAPAPVVAEEGKDCVSRAGRITSVNVVEFGIGLRWPRIMRLRWQSVVE